MDKKEIKEFFDKKAQEWDFVQVRNEDIISLILDKSGIEKGVRILDVASGTGVLFGDYLGREAGFITGIDISDEMINLARKKFPEVELICADAEEYSFKKKYDVIMIYNSFPHFPEPRKLFENLSAALTADGRLTVAHSISMKELEKCHSLVPSNISIPLPDKEILADIMSEFLDVDIKISDDRMYMVSGIKK